MKDEKKAFDCMLFMLKQGVFVVDGRLYWISSREFVWPFS